MARLRDTKGWQGALVWLLMANLLVAVTLTASPKLHELLHRDADRGEHQCAVTVMLSGGSDDSPVSQVFDVGAVFAGAPDFLPEIHSPDVAPLFLTAHVFEHAPPLA
jgi:predicted Kef-type K+ transport protein